MNRLDNKKSFRLAQWIELHKEILLADRPMKDHVAEKAGHDLGFKVTARNVETACRTVNVKWYAHGEAVSKSPRGRTAYTALRLQVMENREALFSIADSLGVKIDHFFNYDPNKKAEENGG